MDTILRKYNSFSVPLTQCINLALDLETKGTLEKSEEFILQMINLYYFAKLPMPKRGNSNTVDDDDVRYMILV